MYVSNSSFFSWYSFFSTTSLLQSMWVNPNVSAAKEAVEVLPVPGVPVIRMLGRLLLGAVGVEMAVGMAVVVVAAAVTEAILKSVERRPAVAGGAERNVFGDWQNLCAWCGQKFPRQKPSHRFL
jgi:hypothetical protein